MIPVALLLSKLDIIFRIFFLVQRDIGNKFTQGLVDWMFVATEQKKLLLAKSIGLVRNSSLVLTIVFGDSDSPVFQENIDLVSFKFFSHT